MAFVLKKKEVITENSTATKEYTYEPAGFKLTFHSITNPAFQKAQGYVGTRFQIETNQPLTAGLLNQLEFNEDSLSYDEAMIALIGKHLVADWDLVDEDGEKVELNIDNFMLLASQVESPYNFITWCFKCAGEVAKSINDKAAETKKKPSSDTNGKKSTQA